MYKIYGGEQVGENAFTRQYLLDTDTNEMIGDVETLVANARKMADISKAEVEHYEQLLFAAKTSLVIVKSYRKLVNESDSLRMVEQELEAALAKFED